VFDGVELTAWLDELDAGVAETLRLVDVSVEKAIANSDEAADYEPEPTLCRCPECGYQWVL